MDGASAVSFCFTDSIYNDCVCVCFIFVCVVMDMVVYVDGVYREVWSRALSSAGAVLVDRTRYLRLSSAESVESIQSVEELIRSKQQQL
jgi:hypothetical protein